MTRNTKKYLQAEVFMDKEVIKEILELLLEHHVAPMERRLRMLETYSSNYPTPVTKSEEQEKVQKFFTYLFKQIWIDYRDFVIPLKSNTLTSEGYSILTKAYPGLIVPSSDKYALNVLTLLSIVVEMLGADKMGFTLNDISKYLSTVEFIKKR